mgnify:CR=1 FL=1
MVQTGYLSAEVRQINMIYPVRAKNHRDTQSPQRGHSVKSENGKTQQRAFKNGSAAIIGLRVLNVGQHKVSACNFGNWHRRRKRSNRDQHTPNVLQSQTIKESRKCNDKQTQYHGHTYRWRYSRKSLPGSFGHLLPHIADHNLPRCTRVILILTFQS